MPRASWRGHLRLSLVSCPVYLMPATVRSKPIRLHQVRHLKPGNSEPRALGVSPRSPLAHFAKAVMLRVQGRAEEAIPEFETVISFDRNWTYAISMHGQCKFLTRSIEEAIFASEQAIRLSPRDPALGLWYWQIGMMHMLQSRIDEAIDWFEKARRSSPESRLPHAYLASAYALKGEMARAGESAPGVSSSSSASSSSRSWRYPKAWDMLMFGMRLGADPRTVVTTTPRPAKLIRDLVRDPICVDPRVELRKSRQPGASIFRSDQSQIRRHQARPAKPFVWTQSADAIRASRCYRETVDLGQNGTGSAGPAG